jgi:D-amino-acid dehydrogenase
MKADVIVLGAGIVGVAAALQLQKRGRAVVLVDRKPPGEETSFGNAGLIQREAYYPYSFPRGFQKLIRYALNGESEAHYQVSSLLGMASPLFQYWRNASPERIERTIRVNRPLFERCLIEHELLAREAGVTDLLRPGGWVQLFRKASSFDARMGEAARLRAEFGVSSTPLDAAGLAAVEPHLDATRMAGAIHWHDPASLREPVQLTRAYVRHFEALGGRFVSADARTLAQDKQEWCLADTQGGQISARDAVVALGAWSTDVIRPLGYRLPLFVKRGYHVHYRARGNATLNHTTIDADTGFAMAAMERGIRMTTGAEFAHRDAPPTPVQVDRCAPRAREWLPLEDQVETTPWMGRRPCFPDMIPVIGPAAHHKGLWLLFGHAHHGLTNAAVSGRLIAEMVTGEVPFCDVSGFAANRSFA